MSLALFGVHMRDEQDVVAARQRSRQVAALLGFDGQDQTRLATAVSEIARNAVRYEGAGRMEFVVEGLTVPQVLTIRIVDAGPGIPDLQRILDGQYHSTTGMGLGIIGTRRLVDQFAIESSAGRGTQVTLRKLLPRAARLVDAGRAIAIAGELVRRRPRSALEEAQHQNQELLSALATLQTRQEELARLNRELEDTNRGVVALYAELDEKADHLRRADQLKSRFLSNMSHEFRTPVNSILALSRLLLDRLDGPLTDEQGKQVTFIRKAAQDLSELVNDLLDLAKVEAGKVVVHPAEFLVSRLFGALRGMLRPLLVSEQVALVFEAADHLPPLITDEGKISQILRNFISNALKFTERGEVRVSAELADDAVVFAVADTGIGIASADQERIFEEFTQLDNPVQRRVMGTGLGLPLARKLAHLLGGELSVESTVGQGSTFRARIPIAYRVPADAPAELEVAWTADPGRLSVIVVEDAPESALLYEKYLKGSPFQVLTVRTVEETRRALDRMRPAAIVLDILLEGEDAWALLAELKGAQATRTIPMLVVTTVDDPGKAFALGADAFRLKPLERAWLLETLERLTATDRERRVLIIDNDETARYVLRHALRETPLLVSEADGGAEGLARALLERPGMIFLDLVMPDIAGEEVLKRLKDDALTQDIPVVIVTSKALDAAARERLGAQGTAILFKDEISGATVSDLVRSTLAGAAERPS
jgi:signal transduction histidine kinase/DNA-binding response OmpR family regulator